MALEAEAVQQIAASYAFKANLLVLRTADEMAGTLLDARASAARALGASQSSNSISCATMVLPSAASGPLTSTFTPTASCAAVPPLKRAPA